MFNETQKLYRFNIKKEKKQQPLLEKEKLFFLLDCALPLSTENTLFQHNLIYFVFPLASILSNRHCCPDFLGKWGVKWRERKGNAVQWVKIQLLKTKENPASPFRSKGSRGKVPHHPSRKVHFGNGYVLTQHLKNPSLLFLHFAQDGLKLSSQPQIPSARCHC